MDQSRQTLCPGYTHVDEFAADEDDAYESGEEVEYITLDLGNIEPTLVPSSATYRLIGLDTPTPILQLSGTILQGSHEELLGSELIFTDDRDTTERGKKSVVHVCTTSKRISFKEIRLRPQDKTQEHQKVQPVIEEDDGLEYADPDPDPDALEPTTSDGADDYLEYADLHLEPSSSSGVFHQPSVAALSHRVGASSTDPDGPETGPATAAESELEESVDPLLLIEHLAGISQSLRADHIDDTESGSMSKARRRAKGKGKAIPQEPDDKMDTTDY